MRLSEHSRNFLFYELSDTYFLVTVRLGWKFRFLLQPPLTPYRGKSYSATFDWGGIFGSLLSFCWYYPGGQGEGHFITLRWDGGPGSILFSKTILQWDGERLDLTAKSLVQVGVQASIWWGRSEFLLQCFARRDVYCSKLTCGGFFFFFFFTPCPLVFWGCWLLQHPVWDIWGKKKIREIHCHGPYISRAPTILSPL